MHHSPPGFSVHGILQTRILEWVAMPSSRESSWIGDWTHVSSVCICLHWQVSSLPLAPSGKPVMYIYTMKYYSATRKKIILPFVATCLDLEDISLVLYSCLLWLFKKKYLLTVREEFWGPSGFFGTQRLWYPEISPSLAHFRAISG